MSISLAILTRDPNLLRCELLRLRDRVPLATARATDALGLGSIQGRDVLLRKQPGSAGRTDAWALGKNVEGEAALAHLRRGDGVAFKDENVQPFRYRRWLFAFGGGESSAAAVRAGLSKQLPDLVVRQAKGDTDRELAFLDFLHHLPATSRVEDADVPASAAAKALGETARDVERVAAESGAPRAALSLVATDGRVLAACRLGGGKLHYALLEGIARCDACGITEATPETQPLVRQHRKLRSVAVATELTGANGWIEVPNAYAVAVSTTLDVQVLAI